VAETGLVNLSTNMWNTAVGHGANIEILQFPEDRGKDLPATRTERIPMVETRVERAPI
jgi:hypothetical protein